MHYAATEHLFLPSAHSGHRVLSCPARSVRLCIGPFVHMSNCPPVHPTSFPLYSPQYFMDHVHIWLSHFTLVWAWTLLIMGFICSFSSMTIVLAADRILYCTKLLLTGNMGREMKVWILTGLNFSSCSPFGTGIISPDDKSPFIILHA